MNLAARNLLCTIVAIALLQAQNPTGELRIEVEDPSGAPMAASGHLKNTATGADRPFQTDPQGKYTFEAIPEGNYRLEVAKGRVSPRRMRPSVCSPENPSSAR